MTLQQIRDLLIEAGRIGSVEWIFFEGGEPFLFYPVMLEGIRFARELGFEVGIVTNAYWATSEQVAQDRLHPLAELGLAELSISDDSFHKGNSDGNRARRALAAAAELSISASTICIQQPYVEAIPGLGLEKGRPVIGGGAMFKGRAVETLTAGLPRRPWQELTQCPHEDLRSPSRVHIDPYGYVHLCQGISIGNAWQHPLSLIVQEYEADTHPICSPLVEGGPTLLAQRYDVDHEAEYVDECHCCYLIRRALIDRFPDHLAPGQVYGFEEE
jgi:hypothetical protein